MKLRIVVIMFLLWATAGCNTDVNDASKDRVLNDPGSEVLSPDPVLEVNLPVAIVDVMPYNPAHLKPQDHYDVGLQVTYNGEPTQSRTLRLSHSADAQSRGFSLSLFDGNENLLVAITQRWGMEADSTYHYFLDEATPEDWLTLSAVVVGEAVSESYLYNGTAADFVYTRYTSSQDSAIQAFSHFYLGPDVSANRTLDNNREGEMMMRLVLDTAFVSWSLRSIRPADENGPMAKVACDEICNTCNAASGCAMLKCPFGNIANPVCVACTGIGAACFITWVSHFFIDF